MLPPQAAEEASCGTTNTAAVLVRRIGRQKARRSNLESAPF
jgi:hypothetical protein